jgi:hypothetical protein
VYVETHRNRKTTDLFFTLQPLDCFPDLRLTADVSHHLSAANSLGRWTRSTTR